MDWKIVVWIAMIVLIGWYMWLQITKPPQMVTITAMPKSQQKPLLKKEQPVDPIAPYFTPATEIIPKDETMIVQSCPFSKPLSTDLPVVDMPRCTVLSEKSYRMSEFKH
jgi:hypothetical protein